jgi:hypothetical protein
MSDRMSSKETYRLIPGLLTHVELDHVLGSPRTRQRWEADGLLPRGRWLKGFQKRIGLYPEIVLARIVGGVDARESEAAVREAMAIGTHLINSSLFEEIAGALGDVFDELTALDRTLLEYVNERGLLEPLQAELNDATAELIGAGIDFRCKAATVTRAGTSLAIVDVFGAETLVAAPQVLGVVGVGDAVVIEEVHVGPRAHSYLLPAGAAAPDPREEMWAEMFAAVDVAPVPIPLLADEGGDPDAGDLVRAPRRLRIDLPAELYAGANPMTRARSASPAE